MDEKVAHILCLLLIVAIVILIISYLAKCKSSSKNENFIIYPSLCQTSGGYPDYFGSLPPLLPVAAQLGVNYTRQVNNPYSDLYASLSTQEGFSMESDANNNYPVYLLNGSCGSRTPNYIAGPINWNIDL